MQGSALNRNLEFTPASCWQAVCSRDDRFDGRFVAAIVTTGVYCRPICPASFGRAHNVRWFRSAISAEAAGFRPCKRCRPATLPGSPAWAGSSAVVSRALRLIAEGALNEDTVEQLADRVGIGSRHLRRLFRKHLGTSPLRIARAHRVQAAQNLIDRTHLPITEIAISTGFRSIRQFNDSVRTAFGASPTQLRRGPDALRDNRDVSGVLIHLPYRPPFDWLAMIRFLQLRATPGVEVIGEQCYRRTIEIHGLPGAIAVWPEENHSRLSVRIVLPGYDHLPQVVRRVRRMFDLGADPLRIGRCLRRDRRLASVVMERPGLRVPVAWDCFELAVRAALGQQITVVDTPAVIGGLVQTFGRRVEVPVQGLSHLFPGPDALVEADLEALGIPSARSETIRSLARVFSVGALTPGSCRGLENVFSRLQTIQGIGEGILSYIAMRGLGEPDAFPATDPGLQRALGIRRSCTSASLILRDVETLRPWRAYAAMHLATSASFPRQGTNAEV